MSENIEIRIDLEKSEEYILYLNKKFDDVHKSQEMVVTSYNKVIDVWCDPISQRVGDCLRLIQASVKKANEEIGMYIKYVDEYGRQMSECYIGRAWAGHFKLEETTLKVREDDRVNSSSINGSTIEGIRSFEKALEEYIENTRTHVAEINNQTVNINEYWDDKIYEKTKACIDDFCGDMKKYIDTLEELKANVTKRRIAFEIAINDYLKKVKR